MFEVKPTESSGFHHCPWCGEAPSVNSTATRGAVLYCSTKDCKLAEGHPQQRAYDWNDHIKDNWHLTAIAYCEKYSGARLNTETMEL